MPTIAKRYVTYVRVSTQKQGASGLGLEAQRRAVDDYLRSHGGKVVAEFKEVESGKNNARRELVRAIHRCRQTRSVLLVAKIDRLSRNAAFLLNLRDSGVRFVAADLPDMNETVVGIMAVMAQAEREAISQRTKAALAACKARGVKLGNPRLRSGNRSTASVARQGLITKADAFATDLKDVVDAARTDGVQTLHGFAAHLNSLSVPTRRGGEWTPCSVSRLLSRLDRPNA
jgi:DNA invertase Pin-like site-specific DNA recombinase